LQLKCQFDTQALVGTSIMPHFGQRPGSLFITSGCIGQVYVMPPTGDAVMPHTGSIAMMCSFIVMDKHAA
jgi:hypothetical protein